MAPYGLLVLPIVLSALTLWIISCGAQTDGKERPALQSSISNVLPVIFVSHLVGLASFTGQILLPQKGIVSDAFAVLTGIAAVSVVMPFFTGR